MQATSIEADYPITFRAEEARSLGEYLNRRQSVDLIGMKRVGISNFLRFFLNHPDVVTKYISQSEKHLFIPIDLNDLVERELFPFWTLTLKRIADASERSELPDGVKQKIAALFLTSIQSQDLFFLMDSIRQALIIIAEHDIFPTLFFLRFDRIKEAVNPAFFDNLQGLLDATQHKLCYVFTSFRSLDSLSPEVFPKAALALFVKNIYVKPAKKKDAAIIYAYYKKRFRLTLSHGSEQALLALVDGYVQYLQLGLVILHEKQNGHEYSEKELLQLIQRDERIHLQSEELWESLSSIEREVLLRVHRGEGLSQDERKQAEYLWHTGFVVDKEDRGVLFSGLFAGYLDEKKKRFEHDMVYFSKKEHLLFTILEQRLNELCERDAIVESVWPEYREFGVSDWAIDRLVARVRAKLKLQQSKYEIKTIRTRGYKLVGKGK